MGLDRWPGVARWRPQGPAGFSIVNEGLERERTEVPSGALVDCVQATEHIHIPFLQPGVSLHPPRCAGHIGAPGMFLEGWNDL